MHDMYTAVYKKAAKGCVAWIEEIPGVNTQGATKQEAMRNLRDALKLFVSARRALTRKQGGTALRREKLNIS